MSATTLKQTLARIIAKHLPKESNRRALIPKAPEEENEAGDNKLNPDQIATDLITQAIASGLPLSNVRTEKTNLTGGNTAEFVHLITMHAPFVFKCDKSDSKLANEAKTIRKIKSNTKLPKDFRNSWPEIYAVRDQAPYAYLMEFFPKEDGWVSLEDRLYPVTPVGIPAGLQETTQLVHKVLDVLFSGFAGGKDTRTNPSLKADYCSRIRDRLEQTAKSNPKFISTPITINGDKFKPWEYYLNLLESNEAYLDKIKSPFTTVVHGDPNPGNLMLRTISASIELKFIDPKEWLVGDYIFDICKITHFIACTGPIEKLIGANEVGVTSIQNKDEIQLSYNLIAPSWTDGVLQVCLARVQAFAEQHNDPHWRARYELGMAANILGLPLGRLKKKHEDFALALYGEGIRWLHLFCNRLPSRKYAPAFISCTLSNGVKPASLQKIHHWIRAKAAPNIAESIDRRGFQLLKWGGQKKIELSLEHEARLLPATSKDLQRLLQALHDAEGRTIGEYLLPGNALFRDLIINRYDRSSGPQSVDHYYDILHSSGSSTLISQMISIRQRIKDSSFMTWGKSGASTFPLNLEMPFVSIGGNGMTARLEFNWLGNINNVLTNSLSSNIDDSKILKSPLLILGKFMENLNIESLVAVLEHTTYREKFSFCMPKSKGGGEVLVLNIDHITAQDLKTGRIGSYVDVDISGTKRINLRELKRVMDFSDAVASRFNLLPNLRTKAWRDAEITGLLP